MTIFKFGSLTYNLLKNVLCYQTMSLIIETRWIPDPTFDTYLRYCCLKI
jgi:hypothetical protein